MKLVIDTNVLLVSISRKSKYNWLFQAIVNREFEVYITNEILTEYDEIISKHWHPESAKIILTTLIELPNVHFTQIYFNWQLIKEDPDDDKFVDCAFVGNVDYLITEDKHFNILKEIEFPKINIIRLKDFQELYFRDKII